MHHLAQRVPLHSSSKERPCSLHHALHLLTFPQKLGRTSPDKRKNRALLAAMIQCAEGQSYFSSEGILAPPPSASDDKDAPSVTRAISRMTAHEWEVSQSCVELQKLMKG